MYRSKDTDTRRQDGDNQAMNDLLNSQGLPKLTTVVAGKFYLLLLVALLLVSCSTGGGQVVSANVVGALSGQADAGFARALEPMEFHFPADHGAHPQYRTEWWYYTGNLTDTTGEPFGYQLTFFRSGLTPGTIKRDSDWASNQIYMAHLALSDVQAEQHYSFERFSRGAGGLAGAIGTPDYEIWLDNWTVRTVEPGKYELNASDVSKDLPIALHLTLEESRPPLLHGNKGLSQKGKEAGNANYYYSLVGIQTSGTITVGDKASTVQGLSWMDHEFGTSALSENAVGWDWFSVQLDDGLVLMFAQLRTKEGAQVVDFGGTLAWPDGRQQALDQKDFSLTATGEWTSQYSGIVYPSGWQVDFPALKLQLQIDPLIQDQEMRVSFLYWEGAVKIAGTLDGEAVNGVGYVELTGYGQNSGEYQR